MMIMMRKMMMRTTVIMRRGSERKEGEGQGKVEKVSKEGFKTAFMQREREMGREGERREGRERQTEWDRGRREKERERETERCYLRSRHLLIV